MIKKLLPETVVVEAFHDAEILADRPPLTEMSGRYVLEAGLIGTAVLPWSREPTDPGSSGCPR